MSLARHSLKDSSPLRIAYLGRFCRTGWCSPGSITKKLGMSLTRENTSFNQRASQSLRSLRSLRSPAWSCSRKSSPRSSQSPTGSWASTGGPPSSGNKKRRKDERKVAPSTPNSENHTPCISCSQQRERKDTGVTKMESKKRRGIGSKKMGMPVRSPTLRISNPAHP